MGDLRERDTHRSIGIQGLLECAALVGLPLEGHQQRRHRQAGDFGPVADRGRALEPERDLALLRPDLHRGSAARDPGLVVLGVEAQRDRLVRIGRHALDRAGVHLPVASFVRVDAVAAGGRRGLPAQEPARRAEAARRLELRILVIRPPAHGRATTHEQVRVGQVAAGLVQHLDQRAGEDPAVVGRLLRELRALAGGQQDVRAGGNPERCAGLRELGVVAVQVALQRPLPRDFMGDPWAQASKRIDAPGAGAGVAAIEDDGDMRTPVGHFGDQDGQFLVRQVVATRPAAVHADQAFVLAIGVKVMERRGRSPARTVAAIVEHRHVARPRLAQVLAECADEVVAGRVGVLQDFDAEAGWVEVPDKVVAEVVHIVHATGQGADARRISVDADQQRTDLTGHGDLLPKCRKVRSGSTPRNTPAPQP